MNNKKMNTTERLLTTSLAIIGAVLATKYLRSYMKSHSSCPHTNCQDDKQQNSPYGRVQSNGHVYFIGGGLASLAGAAYLLRDCHFKGEQIHILEGLDVIGGSNDGWGNAETGYIIRGGHILNKETYENFWELFSTIPSLDKSNLNVAQEILEFDAHHPTHSCTCLIDKHGNLLNVTNMGFNQSDCLALAKLLLTPEKKLDYLTIEDWFVSTPHFFKTNFWYMWQTTFAFQKGSSLSEFRRYLNRMMFEFPRVNTLKGITHTPYNQYESIILPLKNYLKKQGVEFSLNTRVTEIDFKPTTENITVTTLHLQTPNGKQVVLFDDKDICIMTNGCMTDNASLGDFKTPAPYHIERPMSAILWSKIAKKKPELGNPSPFFNHPDHTNWESFTVTCKGNLLLKQIEAFSDNVPGSSALITFKDSNWLMSIMMLNQPHFKNQPEDVTVFWGYGLHTDRVGNYVSKKMCDCTGEEILTELLHHLHLESYMDQIIPTIINVIPCMMPYINAQLQPHKYSDRPAIVPHNSNNFAMISQFVEIPEDMVFTEEYSVRAAKIAIYTLLGVSDRPFLPTKSYKRKLKTLINLLKTMYR